MTSYEFSTLLRAIADEVDAYRNKDGEKIGWDSQKRWRKLHRFVLKWLKEIK
jgi:hypothetical protein